MARCDAGHGTEHRLEVADIFRAYGETSRKTHRLSGSQLRVMRDIETCRTALLGGHMTQCDHCGDQVVRYRSCGNRHCPKCQTLTKVRWVEARLQELLEVPYFHCVFTVPHALNPLALGNPRVLYGLVFASASDTLQTFGHDPKWLGGDLGITMVLHTWGQTLEHHIHVHCVVTGGALAPGGQRWLPTKRRDFLFPVKALATVFRSKYLEALCEAYHHGHLQFAGATAPLADPRRFQHFLQPLWQQPWVAYAKPPFDSAHKVVSYLGRYTHRVALSNNRLVALQDHRVSFKWRDYRHGNTLKTMTLSASEFIRRFLLHIVPTGFMRIRHYGVLGNRCRKQQLSACRLLLKQAEPPPKEPESAATLMRRLTGIDIDRCRHCHRGRLKVILTIYPLWQIALLPCTPQPP